MGENLDQFVSTDRWDKPQWALLQRNLIGLLNRAAPEFVERYTRADGTLIWRSDWPGMDGSDDPYEGFKNLALLYVLGGNEQCLHLARRMWETITWQWTEYGQIYREFDAYYDWMHHGESYIYLYFLGLADASSLMDRQRAVRFASFYDGSDAEAQNYDPEKKLIRSPISGSRGPRFETTEEDWCTHRGILDHYLPPFEDLPGVPFPSNTCAWSDDGIYRSIIDTMNERMTKGDVPLNLVSTSLLAHAFLHTGEKGYKQWVLDYHAAWKERTVRNGGIIPDNVGLDGEIGAYNQGKWWGGYYGWRWPHGFMTIIEPLVVSGLNSLLLTGDDGQLDLVRSQLDRHWQLRREEDGRWFAPHRKFDTGWSDYRPVNPVYGVHLWAMSMKEEDAERVERIGDTATGMTAPAIPIGKHPKTGELSPSYPRMTKHFIANTLPWFNYMRGRNPNYPVQALEANLEFIHYQLDKVRSEEGDPAVWALDGYNIGSLSTIHKWQDICPIMMEQLAQLTLGAPMHIAHGGLQFGRVRYYDPAHRRPGLPDSVAALVEQLGADSLTLSLVNLNDSEARSVIVQAGVYGEHRFGHCLARNQDGIEIGAFKTDGKWLQLRLEPGCGVKLEVQMELFSEKPSYETPWFRTEDGTVLRGRSSGSVAKD
ncbi:hypothetical protein SAMN03159341_13523 [Paenibacillus sp. 1_12]|nr:hypothetical protein [Paenibacillus sp. 1_12]SFM46046.1 hypothetical protein SAMN03159341_13523 [Paenibacillus sp. 1_12]